MKHPLRAVALCAMVVLASACASSVAGTAEVNPAAAALTSISPSGPQSFPDPTDSSSGDPESTAEPESSDPESSDLESTPDESSPSESSDPESSDPESSAPSTSAPVTSAPVTSAPSTSAPVTSVTSAPPTSKSVSRLTKLSCSTGYLIPTARTFCYRIPAGFVDGSSTATYPGTDPVKSAIQAKGTGRTRDLIFVTSTVLDVDADKLDDAVIKASLAKAFAANTSAAGTTAIKESTIAGDRAFETTIKFTDGVQQRYLIIFAGFTRVSVSCQWQDQAAAIKTACTSVLGSLQIKNP